MKFRRKTYETKQEKQRDFWIGFGGWFGVNGVIAMVAWGFTVLVGYLSVSGNAQGILLIVIWGIVPLLLNVAGLIYFGLTRKWITFGALVAFGAALLLGLCVTAACFAMLGYL